MKEKEMISILLAENKEMKELLQFTNNELADLFHSVDEMEKDDVKAAISYTGGKIESFLNKRR